MPDHDVTNRVTLAGFTAGKRRSLKLMPHRMRRNLATTAKPVTAAKPLFVVRPVGSPGIGNDNNLSAKRRSDAPRSCKQQEKYRTRALEGAVGARHGGASRRAAGEKRCASWSARPANGAAVSRYQAQFRLVPEPWVNRVT